MKSLSIFLLCFFSLATNASDLDLRRHIEVSATAELLAEPDFATWKIKIRGEADSLVEASQRLDKSTAALRLSLDGAGFEDEVLRLSTISSGRHYVGDRDEKVFQCFFAERSALIEIHDLTRRQDVERILLEDDRIEISDVTAQSSQHDELRSQVLLNSAEAAKSKASELAAALGAELGEVLSIQQGSVQYGYGFITSNTVSSAPEGIDSAELKKLSYHATVTVKFELK